MSQTRKLLKKSLLPTLLVLLCMLTLSILLYTGTIWPNDLFVSNYSVQGIDVSSYQKSIDWKSVARTGKYKFVFIKATEGKTYKDAYFQTNWHQTKAYGLLRGAYHFYTPYLTGTEQADNYISVVPKEAGMLPPVLDLELSGTNRQVMLREIKIFLDRLQQHYGMRPIIYTDYDRYVEYIKGNFVGYITWIGEAFIPVQWRNINNWTFWQYCDRGYVPGISGFVDLNVFSGDRDHLRELSKHSI